MQTHNPQVQVRVYEAQAHTNISSAVRTAELFIESSEITSSLSKNSVVSKICLWQPIKCQVDPQSTWSLGAVVSNSYFS